MRPIRVLALTRYGRKGPSSRLRFLTLIDALEHDPEFSFTVSPLIRDDDLDYFYQTGSRRLSSLALQYTRRLIALTRARRFDVVWIEKELFPAFPALFERLLRRLGIPVVVDFDDPTYLWYEDNPSPFIKRHLRRKIDVVMQKATVIVCGNAQLADRAREIRGQGGAADAAHLEPLICPTTVPAKLFEAYRASGRADETFRIGWMGTPSNLKFLDRYASALRSVVAEGGARLELIGGPPPSRLRQVATWQAWSEETEAAVLRSWHTAVAPLDDVPWAHGKCGYKILQYMAAGLPVIASPVGVARQFIEDGVTGFFAKDSEQCAHHLRELQNRPGLARDIGERARRRIEAQFSSATWQRELQNVLRTAAAAGGVGASQVRYA